MARKHNLTKSAADLLKRLDASPGGTIESGRVGVAQPSAKLPDLDSLIDFLPGEQERRAVRAKLKAGRETAAATATQAVAAQERAAVQQPFPIPAGSSGSPGGSGIEILMGTTNRPPHTLTTKKGKFCHTDRWFDTVGLCYDAGKPKDARGGMYDPMLYIAGRGFRVYYPASTAADFKGIMTSGSSGRWLHKWSLKSAYVGF